MGQFSYLQVRKLVYLMYREAYNDVSDVPDELVTAVWAAISTLFKWIVSEPVYCSDAQIVYVNSDRIDAETTLKAYAYSYMIEHTEQLSSTLVAEDDYYWYAVTGPMGLETENEKRVKAIVIRGKSGHEAQFSVYIAYDERGEWNEIRRENRGKTGSYKIAYIPQRRCDTYRLKFTGVGEHVIYSIITETEDAGNVY